MAFGLTPSGFVAKLTSDCNADIVAAMQTKVDPNFDMSPDQPIGQMGTIMASELAALWELGRAVYSGLNPNNAEGFILDGDAAYTGTTRDPLTYSTTIAVLHLTAGTTITTGATASVAGQPNNTWTAVGTIKSGVVSGAVTPGPFTASITGDYLVQFVATTPGPTVANPGTLTTIVTPVSGWTTITNPYATVPGKLVQSDSALLAKRQAELAASGASTVDSIRAKLLSIVNPSTGANAVQQAFVYENNTDFVDANNVPPHSIHVVIYDGATPAATNQQIADAIWSQKGSGINTSGATSQTTLDSAGNVHTINFDRATIVPVYLAITTTRGATFDAVNGPNAMRQALVAYWSAQYGLGVPMIARYIGGAVNSSNIQGLVDVPTFKLGISYNPSTTVNINCSQLQILTLNLGNDGGANPYILIDGVGVP